MIISRIIEFFEMYKRHCGDVEVYYQFKHIDINGKGYYMGHPIKEITLDSVGRGCYVMSLYPIDCDCKKIG